MRAVVGAYLAYVTITSVELNAVNNQRISANIPRVAFGILSEDLQGLR